MATTCPNCSYASAEVFAYCPKCGTKVPELHGPADPLLGRTLNGKYRVLSEIGVGSMGTVYLGEHIGLKKRVALKVLHTNVQAGREARSRFQREGIAAGQFTHPNAIQIFDFDMDEGPVFYLAMEFVEGVDLKRLIGQRGALPTGEALEIARQVLGALGEAHRHGIVHRDLKPENIMVVSGSERLTVKVLDFGLSKLVDRPLDASMTEVGRVIGTPLYMSPEQVAGDAVDHRADLYAAGLVFFEMLTGKPPFSGRTLQEILGKHLKEIPPLLVDSNPDLRVPLEFDTFLQRALEKDRARRFQTAEEMLAALEHVRLDGALTRPGQRPSAPRDARPPARRLRRLLAAGGVVALAVATVAVLMKTGATAGERGPARVRARPAASRSAAEVAYLGLLDAARADLLAGDTGSAFSKVQEALRAEEADAEGYLVRGLVYRKREDDDTARMDLREALNLDPDYAEAAAQLGWLELERGDREGALARFLEASRLDPDSAHGLAGQGAVCLAEGRLDDAKQLLSRAVELDQELSEANLFLGRACLARGEHAEAVDAFVRAKRISPGSAEACAELGQAYAALDRWEDARVQFLDAIRLDPDAPGPRAVYGALLLDRGQFELAASELTQGVAKNPQDAELHLLLGLALSEDGLADGAVAEVEKAIEFGATDLRARLLLGILHQRAGRTMKALEHYEAAIAADEGLAAAHANRGAALIELGRYGEAAPPLERAIQLAPQSPFPHLCLGLLHMEFLGDTVKAAEHLRRYEELGGTDERAGRWLLERVR